MKQYTIGMAGHIDHGKTKLTEALTGINTDRLQEEQERNISIELGYAPLYEDDGMTLSIIDVPGHERFIRQMIAGVSGVDITMLVVAADDGVMPQTVEHLEILDYLKIQNTMVVITKVDLVDDEWLQLVLEELNRYTHDTVFEQAPTHLVDSQSETGISDLRHALLQLLEDSPYRDSMGYFRMPIDQAFQIHGIGTVVRGTVIDGVVYNRDQLFVQPGNRSVSVKSIEQFGQSVESASLGSRAALSIKGVETDTIKRGDVLSNHPSQAEAYRLDIEFKTSKYLKHSIKQRSPIKLHIGTTEVYGRIILFDRNEIQEADETVYAQLELEDSVYAFRHDLFVLRRASPKETIGGGKVVHAPAKKHKFGKQTVDTVRRASVQSPSEQLIDYLHQEEPLLTEGEIANVLNLQEAQVTSLLEQLIKTQALIQIDQSFASKAWLESQYHHVFNQLQNFHNQRPMENGLDKSIVMQTIKAPDKAQKKILNEWVNNNRIIQEQHLVKLPEFEPYIPSEIKEAVNRGLNYLYEDGLTVKEWGTYFPELEAATLESLKNYCLSKQLVIQLTEELVVHYDCFYRAVQSLYHAFPNQFSLKDAKEQLQVSRKYLIPFLETCDQLEKTRREEQYRYWT
ncbi:selenocysteine-specific translation elongation factor [Alkalibacillus almallahensis]|uniref:selenocysteine-specific translation elongation factor n=1 Tax=Alkalibacillus almallahensis TaxID=1379154 RepID=UPI0014241CBA|nr:selenocysteine-specific translation elongation factor [Alkalibacillus almallahensis]NIK10959.1 selenocysteine-specific elongation factor [Alkalibacillus almallahensis]